MRVESCSFHLLSNKESMVGLFIQFNYNSMNSHHINAVTTSSCYKTKLGNQVVWCAAVCSDIVQWGYYYRVFMY